MDKIINKIFPVNCLVCRSPGSIICELCLEQMDVLEKDHCIVCDKYSKKGVTHKKCCTDITPKQLVAVFNYESVVREIIRKSKYYKREFMALKLLALYGMNLLKEEVAERFKDHIVMAVPPNPKNYRKRGFNQADVIALAVSKRLNIPRVEHSVIRAPRDHSQYSYNRYDRFRSVSGVFKVRDGHEADITGKMVLLVDDIVTSGATLLELSKVLYVRGAKEVSCLCLSKKNKTFI